MRCTSLTLLLLGATAQPQDATAPREADAIPLASSLAADDECSAADGQCALNALQLRGAGRAAEAAGANASAAPARLPHILFLLGDDMGWADVGFHNHHVHTPNLNFLRSEGIELTRHYAYKFCSPSRSSFLSGRLPVHVNERNKITEAPKAGVAWEMTIVPAQLKRAGYATHHVGKWHAGFASRSKNMPVSRGFDTSFGYFHGAESHYEQISGGNVHCHRKFADLWLNDGPAYGMNGTKYSGELFRDRALELLDAHDPSTPFFLYFAFANNHKPIQAPQSDMMAVRQHLNRHDLRRMSRTKRNRMSRTWIKYQAMTHSVDETVGRLMEKLREKGMWEDTLVVFTSDNGAVPADGSNFPLRGGKTSDWEGGFRVPAVVSGGLIPPARRNSAYPGITHFADWYTTFCALAGVSNQDTTAQAAGLPPVDGQDLRQALFAGAASPWQGKPLLLSSFAADPMICPSRTTVLVLDDFKFILGMTKYGGWTGLLNPNSTSRHFPRQTGRDCSEGCLYNVTADPGEHLDLSASMPQKSQQMAQLAAQESQNVYNPDHGDAGQRPCEAAVAYGGYWGPSLP